MNNDSSNAAKHILKMKCAGDSGSPHVELAQKENKMSELASGIYREL